MLHTLHIKNIALIRELEVEFAPGLNIMSGETGAGKSIIVDSLNLILGERGDRELIKSGEETAFVEAALDTPEDDALLREYGIEGGEGLILSRELSSSGRSAVRINGRLSTVGVLKAIGERTVDLHGQHEHQSLLEQKNHIGFLDIYGGGEIAAALSSVSEKYGVFRRLSRELSELTQKAAERERRMSVLAFQMEEISAVKYKEGEYDALIAERDKMLSSERVAEALNGAYEGIYGGKDAMLPELKKLLSALSGIKELDGRYAAAADKLSESYYQLEECAYDLRELKDEEWFDEARLEKIEGRLTALNALKRKYGGSMEAAMTTLAEMTEEFELLSDSEVAIEKLKEKCRVAEEELSEGCERLSGLREAAARRFEKEVMAELSEVGLPASRFEVHIERTPYAANGYDAVEFFISTNAGEPVRPMQKVASGGEVSRIMLAFKVILTAGIGTLVFDEIDTGISGRIAHVVAQKLKKLSQSCQVICVTHLPQIAAMADRHYLISKSEEGGHTATHVSLLSGEDRVREVARLAGGDTAAALAHARELIG